MRDVVERLDAEVAALSAKLAEAERERDEARAQVKEVCDRVNVGLWHEDQDDETPSVDRVWEMCVESRERGDSENARAEAAEARMAELEKALAQCGGSHD